MATVKNFLADGTAVDDLEGHIIKASEMEVVYDLLESINTTRNGRRQRTNEKKEKRNLFT